MEPHEAPAYQKAGVDLSTAAEIVRRLKPLAAATATAPVESGLGSFGGFFAFPETGGDQLLIASIDGVGTKTKVARQTGQWRLAGYDIVSHCVNDILTHGARPLFFLDYIGTSRLEVEPITALGEGMAAACREAGCALLGGETAEMPGVYLEGEIDLVGCIVGTVERSGLLPADRVTSGDLLIGLASAGLHTNGYSLARKVLIDEGPGLEAPLPGGGSVGEALSASHRMYWQAVSKYLASPQLHGMAHITGGGLPGNLVRVLPENCRAMITRGSWAVPPIFLEIERCGRISEDEMYHVFNMGIGWILIVARDTAGTWCEELNGAGWPAGIIGRIEAGDRAVDLVASQPEERRPE